MKNLSDNDYIALDFDGVIADSIRESLVVGHNAFVAYSQKGRKVESLDALDAKTVTEAKRLRNYIRYGVDYVYIFFALHDDATIHSQDDFDAFIREHRELQPNFKKLFNNERAYFSTQNYDKWIRLNPLYAGMREFLLPLIHRERLYIISTKLSEYISKIFEGHNIIVPEEIIFFANEQNSKLEIIEELIKNLKIPREKFHFVDDQVDTLLKVRSAGVKIYLAEWGYNNEEQIKRALAEQIKILSLPELLSCIK